MPPTRKTIALVSAALTAFCTILAVQPASAEAPRSRIFAGKVASVQKDGSFVLNVSASRKYPRVTVGAGRKAEWSGLARKGKVRVGDLVMVTGTLTEGAKVKPIKIVVQDPNEVPSQGAGAIKAP